MHKLDSWLSEPYERQAEGDEAIQDEINSLLENEYDIKKIEVFLDAIYNDCLHHEIYKRKIEQALQTGDRLALGEAVFDAVADMLDKWAEDEAVDRYNRGFYG